MEKDKTESSRWMGKQKEQIRGDVTDFSLQDCKECRYAGGTAAILAGCYIGYMGQTRAVMRGGSLLARLPSAVAAGVMLSLGILRLAGINPFTSSDSEVGIDLVTKLLKSSKKSEDSAG